MRAEGSAGGMRRDAAEAGGMGGVDAGMGLGSDVRLGGMGGMRGPSLSPGLGAFGGYEDSCLVLGDVGDVLSGGLGMQMSPHLGAASCINVSPHLMPASDFNMGEGGGGGDTVMEDGGVDLGPSAIGASMMRATALSLRGTERAAGHEQTSDLDPDGAGFLFD